MKTRFGIVQSGFSAEIAEMFVPNLLTQAVNCGKLQANPITVNMIEARHIKSICRIEPSQGVSAEKGIVAEGGRGERLSWAAGEYLSDCRIF